MTKRVSATMSIRVLLADDHQLFREGLAIILNGQRDFEVVGEASDGLEVLVKAHRLRPDLVLMDLEMPGCNGVEAARRIKEELPDTCIVMLTVRDDEEKLFQAIQSGAQGYLLKDIRSQDLLTMLRRAMGGEAAITPALGGRILEEFRRLSRQACEGPEREANILTQREREVLSLVAQGATDNEIADALIVSIYTIKSHRRNILSKLHLDHRREAARYALQRGMIGPPQDLSPG
jgi:DNA-binding NarL/FixJ family response regulator